MAAVRSPAAARWRCPPAAANSKTATCSSASLSRGHPQHRRHLCRRCRQQRLAPAATLTQTVNKATSSGSVSEFGQSVGGRHERDLHGDGDRYGADRQCRLHRWRQHDHGLWRGGTARRRGEQQDRDLQQREPGRRHATTSLPTYGGDAGNNGSTSATLTQTVNSEAPPASLVNASFEVPAPAAASVQRRADRGRWTFSCNGGIRATAAAGGPSPHRTAARPRSSRRRPCSQTLSRRRTRCRPTCPAMPANTALARRAAGSRQSGRHPDRWQPGTAGSDGCERLGASRLNS